MLESINNAWINYVNNLKEAASEKVAEKINNTIGKTLISVGTNIESIALIVIAIGALLWIVKYTKVFRWGIIGYLIGLLTELTGLLMIK